MHAWPDRRLVVTAVDAETGEFVTFDRDGTVSLVDAVGASCAVPDGVAAGHHRRAALHRRRHALGHQRRPRGRRVRVVVIAPLTTGGGHLGRVTDQVAELAARTARVALVTPDPEAHAAIGRNVLDPARRAPAARAGRAQAARVATDVAAVWRD